MRNTLAFALAASYASATATQATCDGYYAGIILAGATCTFSNVDGTIWSVQSCNDKDGQEMSFGIANLAWKTACFNSSSDIFVW